MPRQRCPAGSGEAGRGAGRFDGREGVPAALDLCHPDVGAQTGQLRAGLGVAAVSGVVCAFADFFTAGRGGAVSRRGWAS